jgi:hypothetical protein
MFYNLPIELQRYIYEYDSTHKVKYDNIIQILKKIPSFEYYIIENNEYKCKFVDDILGYYIPGLVPFEFFVVAKSYKSVMRILLRNTFKAGFIKI